MKSIKTYISIIVLGCIAASCNSNIEELGKKAASEYCTCMLSNDSYIDRQTYFHSDSICLIPLNKKYGYRMYFINKNHQRFFSMDSIKNDNEKKEAQIFAENFMNCFLICRERSIKYHMPNDTFVIYTNKDREKCGCK